MKGFSGSVLSKVTRNIRSLLRGLEDPDHPLLGPHLRLLLFNGQFHPDGVSKIPRIKRAILFFIVFCLITQYVKCCFSMKLSSILLILQHVSYHMGVVKVCFFKKHYDKWAKLISYISSTERKQKAENDDQVMVCMANYINHSRKVYVFVCLLAIVSVFIIFSEPYQQNEIVENGTSIYINMFDIYTPFNQEVPPGYYVSMGIQTFIGVIMTSYITAWDTLTVATMIFFAGQLKISRVYCTKIIEDYSAVGSHENIVKCHRFYTTLVKHQKILDFLILPVMTVYLAVISVNLGVFIIQISKLIEDPGALLASLFYMGACLFQLLLFYWYGSDVTKESELVNYGVYESNWEYVEAKVLREVALLHVSTSKRLAFKAGPFNEMSLNTFVSILKLSYSFFTLLNETK